MSNLGRLPIRLPKSRWLFPDEDAVPLTDDERLLLVVLGQRYLMRELVLSTTLVPPDLALIDALS